MTHKTVCITGASSGFGAAAARRFAATGHALILLARRQERLTALSDELSHHGVPIHCQSLDVCQEQAVNDLFQTLPAPFSAIDVLINNAGLALGLEPAHQCDPDGWNRMVDTNIKGLLHCTRAVLPGMVQRNRGHIINIGSIAGNWPYPGGNVYGATKAFVAQFSRNLRADLLGKAVRVSTIEPGMAESEFSLVRFKGDTQKAASVYEGMHPLRPEDIAEMMHWVASAPPHVNINTLEAMPICQAWGHLATRADMTLDG